MFIVINNNSSSGGGFGVALVCGLVFFALSSFMLVTAAYNVSVFSLWYLFYDGDLLKQHAPTRLGTIVAIALLAALIWTIAKKAGSIVFMTLSAPVLFGWLLLFSGWGWGVDPAKNVFAYSEYAYSHIQNNIYNGDSGERYLLAGSITLLYIILNMGIWYLRARRAVTAL